MEIDLPSVLIRVSGPVVTIEHKRTGAIVTTTARQLEAWALRQLRADFTIGNTTEKAAS